MFSFANPHLLYLLFLLPVVAGLYIIARIARRRKLMRYGRIATLTPLMPDASRYKPGIKLVLQLIAIAALVIVLARPRAGAKEEVSEVQGIEVMICLDVSNSMLASSTDDPRGVSRLQRAKLVLEKLIDKLDNDKVGLIVFAGDAYTQLPITSDFVSAKMFLNSISTEMVPTQGTAIGAAIQMAMNSFTPDEDMQRAIIVITDGEILGKPHSADEAVEMLRKLSGHSHTVMTGVTLATTERTRTFAVETTVEFARLSDEEIRYYVDRYSPLDKAGAYGIQEWIGAIGVKSISGSYYNVMGLPLHRLYNELREF